MSTEQILSRYFAKVGALKRTALNLFLICVAVLNLSLASSLYAQATAKARRADVTIQLSGLRDRVTVRRDQRGIPYIDARNENDLYFAQGYVTASDRLWQMDLLRRTARGELSEILGETTLEEDKRRRIFGFAHAAESIANNLSPNAKRVLESYARGANAYIESRDEKSLPVEFQILQYKPRNWTIQDSIVIGKLFAEELSNTWSTDIMREALAAVPKSLRDMLLPERSPLDVILVGADTTPVSSPVSIASAASTNKVEPDRKMLEELSHITNVDRRSLERIGIYMESGAMSNSWVVSGKRTTTGKPLLANDPHLRPSVPSIWYMVHLSAPGLRVAGAAVPGGPGVTIGHNEQIAWGITNLGADVQDLYVERFDTENPRRYMTPYGLREAEVRREEIKVRTGLTGTATRTVPFDVTITRHGPIIFRKDKAQYALRWTALDSESYEGSGFYQLNRASNWKEFTSALSAYAGPGQNFIYADRNGNIGFYSAGRIPVRRTGDGSVPYDGTTDAGEWTGFIPFNSLPHLYNPSSGIIVAANNRIVGQSYPYHLTREWLQPYRARRIYELLKAKDRLSRDDFLAVQADVYSYPAAIFARAVLKTACASESAKPNSSLSATCNLFKDWDGRATAESRAMPIAFEMRSAFRLRILSSLFGETLAKHYKWANADTWIDDLVQNPKQELLPKEFKSNAELLAACEKDARAVLAKDVGPDEQQWTWGRFAEIKLLHPLAAVPGAGRQFVIPPMPQNGSGTNPTVNVGAGVSMRMIADPSNWDSTRQGISLGQSGDPSNPNWKDQLEDWLTVKPRAFPFSKRAIEAATKKLYTLAPTPLSMKKRS